MYSFGYILAWLTLFDLTSLNIAAEAESESFSMMYVLQISACGLFLSMDSISCILLMNLSEAQEFVRQNKTLQTSSSNQKVHLFV